MNNEATLERVTLTEEQIKECEVKTNKQYERTIFALKALATQSNTKLLKHILNLNDDTDELLSYLNDTNRHSFANFLGSYVENKSTAKTSVSSREM